MAENEETADTTATTKVRLTPEERRARVQEARASRVREAFEGKLFEYVEAVELSGEERYTDVTGNKGKSGHKIRNLETRVEITVGPSSLKKAADMGSIDIPEGVFGRRRSRPNDDPELEPTDAAMDADHASGGEATGDDQASNDDMREMLAQQ